MTFQALIPDLRAEWGLTAGEAGTVSGLGYLAYALVAPVAVGATDRVDPRRVVILGCAASVAAGLGFALLARGFWDAALWRMLGGIGIAGTYMPGLKALADRLPPGLAQGRWQALYTATYSGGTALSMLLSGLVAARAGWPAAFALSGLLPAVGLLVAWRLVPPAAPAATPAAGGGPGGARRALDLRPVLRQRRAMGYILGYAGHCWELFGFRTWIVAFLGFAAAASGAAPSREALTLVATWLLLAGLPASLLGNEIAARFGRPRAVAALMAASAALAAALGLAASLPFPLVVALASLYGALVMADSAALTVGTLAESSPALRGATIALQTFLGSVAAMASPLVAGFALDRLGDDTAAGWAAAMALVGAGALLGPVALAVTHGRLPARTGRP